MSAIKPPDIDMLTARIYRHYPRNIIADDPRHWESDESRRLQCVRHVCAENMGGTLPPIESDRRIPIDKEIQENLDALRAWLPFKATLEYAFPESCLEDRSIPWMDPCYRCEISQPGDIVDSWDDEIVCAVSALAPVYLLAIYVPVPGEWTRVCYSRFPSRYQERESKLAALIEETFGFSRLTEDTLLLPVPDVVPGIGTVIMGEAVFMDCLFTPDYGEPLPLPRPV